MTANKELKDTVLIVDDEQAFLDLLSFNLSEAGMKVETAQTAADAMKAVALVRPVVVILDLMLPDASGTEVCRRLRQDPATAEIGVMTMASTPRVM